MALTPDPTRDKCIEATTRIVCSAIESGKLQTINAEEIVNYFSELYGRLYRVVSKSPNR